MSKDHKIDRRSFLSAVSILAVSAALGSSASPALADQGAERFVATVAKQAMAAARTGSASSFKRLVQRYSAISSVALFALGKHRRKLPASRRKEYYALVTTFVAKLFAENSRSFAGQSYLVKSSAARSSKDVIVRGVLQFAGGRDAKLEWRLTKSGSRYRVFDVRVKGVWLAVQMRQEFSKVLNESGGDFNALMKYLKS